MAVDLWVVIYDLWFENARNPLGGIAGIFMWGFRYPRLTDEGWLHFFFIQAHIVAEFCYGDGLVFVFAIYSPDARHNGADSTLALTYDALNVFRVYDDACRVHGLHFIPYFFSSVVVLR